MKKISRYVMKYWYAYVFAIACMTLSVSLDMLTPQITGSFIDDVIIGGKMELFNRLILIILLIGVGRCIFQYFKEYTFDSVSSKIGLNIRKDLFNHIQKLSISFFDKTNTGELMARVKDDVDRIWDGLGFVGMLIIEVIIHTTIVLTCMFRISHKLFIIPCIAMPLVAMFAIIMERKLDSIYEEISEENANLNTIAQENLSGVRTVKAFAREKFEIKKFLSHNNRYYELNMKQSKALVRYQPLFQFITKLLPIVVIIYGGILTINGEITVGELSAFSIYSTNIVWPMEMLGWLTNSFSSAIASTKKIRKLYTNVPEIKDPTDPIVIGDIKGIIDFNHVSFEQNNKKILDDITFHVDAGKTIGIMGATGTGKSSIINILQRFYDATEGTIRLDGVNIKDLTLKELRSNISLVMQDVFLFSDTIKDNIKMGKKYEVSKEVLLESASYAQADQFIDKLEHKYNTVIGERGVGLSGGQKQRISIARALAKKTPILVLDDSTSALDMETEHAIQEALLELRDTTKLIIAHRISAVRNADEIIVLEDGGSIAERGTHEQLLAKHGLYYQTYMSQYGDYLESKQEVTQ
ncbi:ABC transporter ATP-binding protein [Anaerosporobacter faecicola]|uniref:ABC transporter ATP-binding protein n=1 Tax=Anaerosporobacter faecicola TaxID=2718714 RepID=UPI0014387501|nr:ABC transporter ATP-binding protein [Anaerosporobacter faecicola]